MSVEIRIESLNKTFTASPSESLSKILRNHGIDPTKVFKGTELSNETQVGTKTVIVKQSVSDTETPEEVEFRERVNRIWHQKSTP